MKGKSIWRICSLLFIFGFSLNPLLGQQVGEIKLKESGFKGKKFNDANKRIFLQYFYVNFQLMYNESETAKGGREVGGGYRGDASASLSLAVQGVELERLQRITDSCYSNYVQQLKAKGIEIINPDELKAHSYFENWEIVEGGKASAADIPGYISVSPSGFRFFVPKVDENGNAMAKASMFDLAGMSLSKELEGMIVARVGFTVPFARGAESTGSKALTKTFGGVAKVVVKPDLRISPNETYIPKGDFKKPKYSGSEMSFAFKKSLKYQALFQARPKKEIQIEGVFEEKKYKSVQSGNQDLWGTEVGALEVFSVQDESLESIQAIKCEGEIYEKGVEEALQSFINMALEEFLENLK
tara:strand:+ start:621 stop:1688 length:1068 start_codon:yes stop_codon:yes gene_type:complete